MIAVKMREGGLHMVDVAQTEQLLNGTVSLQYEPADKSGALKLTVKRGETVVHSSVVDAATDQGNYGRTQRGKFKNDTVAKCEEIDGLDASDVETAIKNWFSDFLEEVDAAETELRGEIATEIIEGTHTPVEIHGKPDKGTTYNVTLTFRGRTETVEFNADVMVPGSSPGALQSSLAHQFFEPVEVPKEDWEHIREYWAEHSELVRVTETTPDDAKADRVIEYLADTVSPVPEMDDLLNAPNNAWVDTDYTRQPIENVDIDSIVWVQDRHLVDEIDSVSSVTDKGNIIAKLRERAELVDKWRTRQLTDDGETRLWGFTLSALGVSPESVPESDDSGGVAP